MAKMVIPSLSSSGWVGSLIEKIDVAMAHFFTTDYNQSVVFAGNVTSFPYINAMYGNDEVQIVDQTRKQLEAFLLRYFDTATFTVTAKQMPSETDHRLVLTVSGTVTQDGKEYSVGKSVEVANNRLVQILSLNNFGTTA